jgi:hypothetical protein
MWKKYEDEVPGRRINNVWSAQMYPTEKKYVVETAVKAITRCILMTTDPGDLVFDPTCGSGTTAFVAEQWGRRWITCDTSRVALTLARQRLMTSVFDYYELAHPKEGVGSGFRYNTVPHFTSTSTLILSRFGWQWVQVQHRTTRISKNSLNGRCLFTDYSLRPANPRQQKEAGERPLHG